MENNSDYQTILESMRTGWNAFNAAVVQSYLDNDCIAPCVTEVTTSKWTEAITRSHTFLIEAKKNIDYSTAKELFNIYNIFWDCHSDHNCLDNILELDHHRLVRIYEH